MGKTKEKKWYHIFGSKKFMRDKYEEDKQDFQDMQTRITTFRDNAQKQIEAKSNELLKPLTG